MSDTPRVDSYVYKFPGCQREPRLIDFARKLERELAEARAEILEIGVSLAEKENQLSDVLSDRDDARKEAFALSDGLQEARAEIERLKGVVISQITPEPLVLSSYSTTAKPAKDERDKLIEQMRDALKALKQRHYVNDDDNWYSCPASGLCSNDHAGTDCNCGADHANSIIQAALSAAERMDK